MMKKQPFAGILLFWLTWPALWLYLRFSHRTRLLIVCEDEFLVVRSWLGSGRYGLPGGGLHGKEAPIDGVRREVQEEIGLKLDPSDLTNIFSATSKSQGFRFSYQCFLLEIDKKPELKLQLGEIIDAKWLPLELPGLPLSHDVVQALEWWHKQR